MRPSLSVALTCTRDAAPLAVVDGLPGDYAELRPAELRALAAALLRIAANAEGRPLQRRGKPTPIERRVYRLGRGQPGPCAAAICGTVATLRVKALPGRWRELGGLEDLVRLDGPARTAGMALVAKAHEDWQHRLDLRFQVWPEDLEPMD